MHVSEGKDLLVDKFSNPKENAEKESRKSHKRPKRRSFKSYLLHKQSLYFSLCEFDWLHIERIRAFKKADTERRLQKREIRMRCECMKFVQNSDMENGCMVSSDLSSSSGDHSGASSADSEDVLLKRLWRARKKEYCSTCEGLCRLFQRQSKKYFDSHNHLLRKSIRALRRERVSRVSFEEVVSRAEIEALYGRTEKIMAFLRRYKIPKIRNDDDWANDSNWDNWNTAESESSNEKNSSSAQRDINKRGTSSGERQSKFAYHESCNRSYEDSTLENSFEVDKSTAQRDIHERGISRAARQSKFIYHEKYSSSDEDSDSENSETKTKHSEFFILSFSYGDAVTGVPTEAQSNEPHAVELVKFAKDSREDVLSLFAEGEIRLPITKGQRRT